MSVPVRIDATLDLLRALKTGGRLVIGHWRVTGGYGTLPAVIADESDAPLWLGSRHVAVHAAAKGLVDPVHVGVRIIAYRLSREGAALLRDHENEIEMLRRSREAEARDQSALIVHYENEIEGLQETIRRLLKRHVEAA